MGSMRSDDGPDDMLVIWRFLGQIWEMALGRPRHDPDEVHSEERLRSWVRSSIAELHERIAHILLVDHPPPHDHIYKLNDRRYLEAIRNLCLAASHMSEILHHYDAEYEIMPFAAAIEQAQGDSDMYDLDSLVRLSLYLQQRTRLTCKKLSLAGGKQDIIDMMGRLSQYDRQVGPIIHQCILDQMQERYDAIMGQRL